ncbi:hypothetical protein HMPREF9455_00302 [Dysgonomonas gadei ATCC BAA-286]|uniref:Uncharacterized protein n=1 Tax=Dysgonomonas gadei ATCC BAA-286 TaxID=742766 RepID=F5IT85_9BACT|nr:hypothetical protein HMPREF9455_00302 [Dysgonomonas gadei ATCC BAA-286]
MTTNCKAIYAIAKANGYQLKAEICVTFVTFWKSYD